MRTPLGRRWILTSVSSAAHVRRAAWGTMDGWWAEIEHEVLVALRRQGAVEPAEVGRRLGIGERAAVSLLAMLAAEGKVRIRLVEAPAAGSEGALADAPPRA